MSFVLKRPIIFGLELDVNDHMVNFQEDEEGVELRLVKGIYP